MGFRFLTSYMFQLLCQLFCSMVSPKRIMRVKISHLYFSEVTIGEVFVHKRNIWWFVRTSNWQVPDFSTKGFDVCVVGYPGIVNRHFGLCTVHFSCLSSRHSTARLIPGILDRFLEGSNEFLAIAHIT